MFTATSPYNLGQWVTPNHWDVSRFEAFPGVSAAREFDMVAPVFVYFAADLLYRPQAESALKKLKRLRHPLAEAPVRAILNKNFEPDGLRERYNALMMVLADEIVPGIESHIDKHGAYAFTVGTDKCVLAGDEERAFAFYLTSALVRERLMQAQSEGGFSRRHMKTEEAFS